MTLKHRANLRHKTTKDLVDVIMFLDIKTDIMINEIESFIYFYFIDNLPKDIVT